jgi:hypothetical protein
MDARTKGAARAEPARCSGVILSHWPDSIIWFFMNSPTSMCDVQATMKATESRTFRPRGSQMPGRRTMCEKASRGENSRLATTAPRPGAAASGAASRVSVMCAPPGRKAGRV